MKDSNYIIDPQYVKIKAILVNALAERQRMELLVANGAYDEDIPMGLNKLLVVNCQENIASYERWPRVLNGTPFLKENGYRDDLLDDL